MRFLGYAYKPSVDARLDGIIAGYLEISSLSGYLRDPANILPTLTEARRKGKPCELQVYASWDKPSLNKVLTDPALSDQLIESLRRIMAAYPFTGVAFDWECSNTGTITQRQYTDFYRRLASALGPMGRTVSATENYGSVTLLPEAATFLDYVGIMVYDVAPAEVWYGTIDHVRNGINAWVNAGFPHSSLMVGVNYASRPGWAPWYDGGPFHETPDTMKAKVAYIREQGVGGIFAYEMGLDKDDPGSLTSVIYSAIDGATPIPPAPQPEPPSVSHKLSLSVVGEGSTSLGIGERHVLHGDTVIVTAQPTAGWRFKTWSWPGNDPNYAGWTSNPTTWAMVEDISLVAVFEQIPEIPDAVLAKESISIPVNVGGIALLVLIGITILRKK